MKYTHMYNKLNKAMYTTIRKYKKAEIGDIVRENYPEGWHDSMVIGAIKVEIGEIPTDILLNDADVTTREEFFKLINSFYRNPLNEGSRVYLYVLMRVDEEIE